LSTVLIHSDSALYPLLEKLQKDYPLVESNDGLTFPEVSNMPSNLNLLTLIPSKSLADLDYLNVQTILDDLKFLIDTANKLFPDFNADMIAMLDGARSDCKVKWKQSDSKEDIAYNASSVRRVFIKWS
jgi:hypothetical protein